jgi:hypothetical protein
LASIAGSLGFAEAAGLVAEEEETALTGGLRMPMDVLMDCNGPAYLKNGRRRLSMVEVFLFSK